MYRAMYVAVCKHIANKLAIATVYQCCNCIDLVHAFS